MKALMLVSMFLLLLNAYAVGQVDSSSVDRSAIPDTEAEDSPRKEEHKRVSDFKIYGGVSASKILLSDSPFESASATGYLVGFSYRKGRFGYWEIGVNYNNSVVSLEGVNVLEDNMNIRQLEVPLSAGINLLSVARRVLGIRLFGGVIPGYIIGISDNPFDLEKDDFKRFQFAGRVGVGVDILFLFIEGGYQYGFIDVLNDQDSNLSQLDLRLGFRF